MLSREFSLKRDDLTDHIARSIPEQVPPNFEILEVPQEILLWILSILEESTTTEELDSKFLKKKDHTSRNGLSSAHNPESEINSYQSTTPKTKSKLFAPSWQQSEETFLEELRKRHCLLDLLRIHSDMFIRCSGLTDLAIQELMNREEQP